MYLQTFVKTDEIKNLSKTFQYNTFLLSQPNNTNTIIYHNVKNDNYATVLTLSYAMLQYAITDDILCCAHQTLMVIFPCGTNNNRMLIPLKHCKLIIRIDTTFLSKHRESNLIYIIYCWSKVQNRLYCTFF